MKNISKIITIIAAVALGALLYSKMSSSTEKLDKFEAMFRKWKGVHAKEYSTPQEHLFRKGVFVKNFLKVQLHNTGNSDFKMGLNQFADLTSAEFKTKFTGFRFTPRTNVVKNYPFAVEGDLPENVDWREQGAVTPVKNQGQCGSCWAFSTTGALEGHNVIFNKGELTAYSEQELVDCSGSYGNEGCNGGLMREAFKYVADSGIETEADYAYHGRDGQCKKDASKAQYKISGHNEIPKADNDAMKQAVAGQPVAIAVDAEILQLYFGGIVGKLCGHNLDHGVLAVGYGATEGGKLFWIVKNSWGHAWGEKGYFRVLRYEGVKPSPCGVSLQASYPTN